jgi:hypothetical protein
MTTAQAPKPAEEVRALEQRVQAFHVVPVTDADSFARGGGNLRELVTLRDTVEAEEKKATSPLNQTLAVVRGWFRPMKDKLQLAESQQRRQLAEFKAAEDRREAEARRKAEAAARAERERLEAEARAKEETARREAIEKRVEAERLREQGDMAAAAKLDAKAATVETKAAAAADNLFERARAVVPEPVRGEAAKAAGLGNRKVWLFEVTDPAKINPAFMAPDEKKIGQAVRALKGDAAPIIGPGIRVWSEDDFSARRTR